MLIYMLKPKMKRLFFASDYIHLFARTRTRNVGIDKVICLNYNISHRLICRKREKAAEKAEKQVSERILLCII